MFAAARFRATAYTGCTSLFVVVVFLVSSAMAVPPNRPIVRRVEASLALDSQGAVVQLTDGPADKEHGFVRVDTTDQQHAVKRARTDSSAAAVVVRRSLDAACRALNKLEARIDAVDPAAGIVSVDPAAVDFSVYEAALAAWREGHPGEQPACRMQHLSAALCKDASQLAEVLWSVEGGTSWDARIRELMAHELNTSECQGFAAVPTRLAWNPAASPLWTAVQTANESQQGDHAALEELIRDKDYEAVYASAGHRASAFGPPEVLWQMRPEGRFRRERVEHLGGIRILRKAIPSLNIHGVKQILTFGGGSGDAAAMLFDLGYPGTHLIYDHPAMLLMQRLWLRYSGVPVIMGEERHAASEAVRKKIVLESTLGQKIFLHLDRSQANESLFRSTTFFSQEDVTSFEKIRPVIKDFDIIQFSFQPKQNNIDTSEYLQKFVEEDLEQTHNVLTWKANHSQQGKPVFHFLAMLKIRGPLACLKELNCMRSTLHPSLGRRNNVTMDEPVGESGSLRAEVSLRVCAIFAGLWMVAGI